MRRLVKSIIVIMSLLPVIAGAEAATQPAADPAAAEADAGGPGDSPIASLPSPAAVLAFGDRPPFWTPDWPDELPPDAFALRGGAKARAVAVSVEGLSEYVSRWSASGKVIERPFFWAESGYSLAFERAASGRPSRYRLIDGEGAESDSVSLSFSAEGALSSCERSSGDRPSRSGFYPFGSVVEEIRYVEDGIAEARASFDFAREGLRSIASVSADGTAETIASYDYDAGGRISAVSTADSQRSAVYGEDGLPRAVRVAVAASGKTVERRLQWDERGLLVREFVFSDDAGVEIAYDYDFDRKGEWIARRATRYVERFGVRIPEAGDIVRRRIDYR